jgi:integrase
MTWFTKREVDTLADHAKGMGHLITFAAYTGLRRGEIWRMQVSDIDWGRKAIHVGGTETTITKTGTHRIVPICRRAMSSLIPVVDPCDRSDLCPWAEAYPSVDAIMRQFNAARDQAGISSDKVFHSLRHSFGTWHAEKGTPIRTIMALMGHKDIKTTLRYAKATDESLFNAMEDF